MPKNVRYHYAKLFCSFFNSRIIKTMLKMPIGTECVLCYQRLILESANTDGWFQYNRLRNNLIDELADLCDTTPDVIGVTISALERCELARYDDDGNLQILFIPDAICIGSETESARRMRITRQNEKKQIENSAQCAPNKDKDKEIYNNNNINDAPEAIIIDFFNYEFKKNYKKTEKNMRTVAAALEHYSVQTINDIIAREARRQQQGEYGRFRPNIAWLLGAGLDECYHRMAGDPGYLSMQHDYDFNKLEKELTNN